MSTDVQKCRDMLAAGSPVADIIAELRRLGLSKVQSIKFLVDEGWGSLAAAKEAVHKNPAWADTRDDDEKFHETLEAIAASSGGKTAGK